MASNIIAWLVTLSLSLVLYLSPSILISFLFCRGSGEDGQLGIGTNEDKEWVCSVKALPSQHVRSVVAGSRNSLAILNDGKVSVCVCTFHSITY